MFNDYPTIGTPEGMRAMTDEEMAERAKRQYLAMQSAHGNTDYNRAMQNAYSPSFFDMVERKPKLTLWQRLKSWIAN